MGRQGELDLRMSDCHKSLVKLTFDFNSVLNSASPLKYDFKNSSKDPSETKDKPQTNSMSSKMSMTFMNENIKDCFSTCVSDFRSAELTSGEVDCLKNCTKRNYVALSLLNEKMQ